MPLLPARPLCMVGLVPGLAAAPVHACRRAKNREAARKSRERKMVRLDNLQRSVMDLQHENELLSGCIAEISQQAISAEAETRLMQVPGHAAAIHSHRRRHHALSLGPDRMMYEHEQ